MSGKEYHRLMGLVEVFLKSSREDTKSSESGASERTTAKDWYDGRADGWKSAAWQLKELLADMNT